MGHWGYGPFENDHALDCAYDMTTADAVVSVLKTSQDTDELFAACEILALHKGGEFQTEHTTLFDNLEGRECLPYVPPEVAEAMPSMTFTDEDIGMALEALSRLEKYEHLRDWDDKEKRETAIADCRLRILMMMTRDRRKTNGR